MQVKLNKATIGSLAAALGLIISWQSIDWDRIYISPSAYASDMDDVRCRISYNEWDRANKSLIQAQAALSRNPNNETLKQAVANYLRDRALAQADINKYCKK